MTKRVIFREDSDLKPNDQPTYALVGLTDTVTQILEDIGATASMGLHPNGNSWFEIRDDSRRVLIAARQVIEGVEGSPMANARSFIGLYASGYREAIRRVRA